MCMWWAMVHKCGHGTPNRALMRSLTRNMGFFQEQKMETQARAMVRGVTSSDCVRKKV